jgi:glycerate 2-kinase
VSIPVTWGGGMYTFAEELLKSGPTRERRSIALDILGAALTAADPGMAVKRFLGIQGEDLVIEGQRYHLPDYRRVLVVGAGKAGAAMAAGVEDVLGDRVHGGIVNVKYGHVAPTRRVRVHEAGHPMPDEQGLAGTAEMVDLLRQAGSDDLVVAVIS